MTPRELAEKIVEKGQEISDDGGSSRRMINWLESLLSEALAEAQKECIGLQVEECSRHVKEARAAAYEECAKIAETSTVTVIEDGGKTALVYPIPNREAIAAAIRLRAGELK